MTPLEQRVGRLERQARAWKWLALGAMAALAFVARPVDAARVKDSLLLRSLDGRSEAQITATGFVFRHGDETRVKLDVGESFGSLTFYRPGEKASVVLGNDELGTALRLFSTQEKLRVAVTDDLLDAGSGLRLYDDEGNARLTLYSGKRDERTGLHITDGSNQPRIDAFAKPGGIAVLRVSDSAATAVSELSVMHESDASFRQLGVAPEASELDPLVPMVYMLDPTGMFSLLMPAKPN